MTYLYQPHECRLPYALVNRAIWACEDCPRVWRATVPGNPAYAGWRRLGPLGRWLHGIRRPSKPAGPQSEGA